MTARKASTATQPWPFTPLTTISDGQVAQAQFLDFQQATGAEEPPFEEPGHSRKEGEDQWESTEALDHEPGSA